MRELRALLGPPRFLEEGSEFWLVFGRDPAAHHEEEEDEEEDLIPLPYLAPLSPLQPQLLFLRLPLQPRSSLPFLPPADPFYSFPGNFARLHVLHDWGQYVYLRMGFA